MASGGSGVGCAGSTLTSTRTHPCRPRFLMHGRGVPGRHSAQSPDAAEPASTEVERGEDKCRKRSHRIRRRSDWTTRKRESACHASGAGQSTAVYCLLVIVELPGGE